MKILSDFYIKNIKDAFNDGLPHITHFVVLHPFLKRSQTLLTFIRHLTLIKSNLIKQKTKKAFSFEQSSNNSIYTFHCNNFEHFLCVVTVVNSLSQKIFYLLK